MSNPGTSDSESDIDEFKDVKQYIEKFRGSLIIPHGKDSLDSLFYAVCYATRYEKLKKMDKCLNAELRKDLPKDLFAQSNAMKTDLVLDLDYQHFEKQCFLINKLLIERKNVF